MGWTETFGTGKCCILWWLSCVAGVERGREGNGGKKKRGAGGEKERTASPFSLSRFSPLPSPLFFCTYHAGYMAICYLFKPWKNMTQSCEIFGFGHFHEQSFWLKHVQFKHFLGSTGKVSSLISQIFLHKHMDPGERKLTVLRVRRLVYIVLVGSTLSNYLN